STTSRDITSPAATSATLHDALPIALAQGSHTLDVRATDAAGNTDASPASHTWTVDLTAPNTTIDTSPSDPSNNTTPSFTFSSSEARTSSRCNTSHDPRTSATIRFKI